MDEQTPTHPKIRRIERLATLLDSQYRVPVIGYRIGLDGLIGLIPGVGDAASALVSLYLVYQAHTLGMRKSGLAAMLGSTAFDFLIGLIPIVGDLFDFVNKSNAKNAQRILDDHAAGRLRETR